MCNPQGWPASDPVAHRQVDHRVLRRKRRKAWPKASRIPGRRGERRASLSRASGPASGRSLTGADEVAARGGPRPGSDARRGASGRLPSDPRCRTWARGRVALLRPGFTRSGRRGRVSEISPQDSGALRTGTVDRQTRGPAVRARAPGGCNGENCQAHPARRTWGRELRRRGLGLRGARWETAGPALFPESGACRLTGKAHTDRLLPLRIVEPPCPSRVDDPEHFESNRGSEDGAMAHVPPRQHDVRWLIVKGADGGRCRGSAE